MTTETRQFIQYVAIGLFAAFTVAVLGVWVYSVVVGKPADGTVLAYLGAIMATVTTLLGVNSGGNLTAQAAQQATAGTAGAIAAANGSASKVASAIQQAHSPTPPAPADGASDSGGGA